MTFRAGAQKFRKRHCLLLLLSCFIALLLCCTSTWATTISADNLEYIKAEDRYIATGNVRIEKEGAVLNADKIIFYQKTSDAEATGHVVYEDGDTLINTERAEINIDAKTGRLYNAVILFKKGNYWITGDNIQKIRDDYYYASTATFTTCDTEPSSNPDWCFKGQDVDIIVGEKITARNVTYRIKGLPLLYFPYIWSPVITERQTGFLFPTIGNSSRKGFQFSPAFFWAISDNMDATLYIDYYSKRGTGTGIEYRYVDMKSRGNWYAYHIRDRELKKNFIEIKGFNDYLTDYVKAYIDINYINEKDFYKEFGTRQDVTVKRFLTSTAEASMPFSNSRLYILGQYWIDLSEEDTHPSQRLPELGYVINPAIIGPLTFTLTSNISNFYRDEGIRGQRLDINPTFSYTFGKNIQLFQSLSLRETAYNLDNAPSFEKSLSRETFQYRANALMRFVKKYESFTHIIEPSLEYRFIPETHDLPLFDSTELFNKTSMVQLSLLNIFTSRNTSISARLSQAYDFNISRPLLPTKLDVSVAGPFILRLDASYDINDQQLKTFNSEIGTKLSDTTTIKAGERYNREEKIMLYKAAIDSVLTKRWAVNASIWYDAKGGGIRESSLKVAYRQQCWAVDIVFSRKPGDAVRSADYRFMILVELIGLGRVKVL